MVCATATEMGALLPAVAALGWARRGARGAVALAALLAPTGAAWAQWQLSELRGRVFEPQGSPLPGAQVVLLDQRGAELRNATCDTEGRFVFKGVSPGSYYLKASKDPLASSLQSVVVGNALAIDLELRLVARAAETVVVTPGPELPAEIPPELPLVIGHVHTVVAEVATLLRKLLPQELPHLLLKGLLFGAEPKVHRPPSYQA